ncbi:MAG: hypothetical protein PHT15_00835 [Gallionellaceae bacterium]|nr:hypothetical protein [Gallionellaceae bacterium]
MLRKPYLRRPLAALLAIAGAMMMFLAPETWAGASLLALGVTIEVAGIALKRRDRQR